MTFNIPLSIHHFIKKLGILAIKESYSWISECKFISALNADIHYSKAHYLGCHCGSEFIKTVCVLGRVVWAEITVTVTDDNDYVSGVDRVSWQDIGWNFVIIRGSSERVSGIVTALSAVMTRSDKIPSVWSLPRRTQLAWWLKARELMQIDLQWEIESFVHPSWRH